MSKRKNITVIGGDDRHIYMIENLCRKGYQVITYGFSDELINNITQVVDSLEEAMSKSDILVCPIPFSRNKVDITFLDLYEDKSIEKFINNLNKNHMIFSAMIPKNVTDYCLNYDIRFYDLLKNNGFAMLNAVATAEGSIAEAISMSKINLHKSNCIVIGYGRCAQILAKKLKSLDANVCVVARNIDSRSLAQANGYSSIPFDKLNDTLVSSDFIFNTVPSIILVKDNLKYIPSHAIIIDIASSPGGVDYISAKELKIQAKNCLGLPGKYAPKSSGEIIAQVIENILSERSSEYEVR
ncbi:dipicolinate synthase subunit DpsA [Sedimentibacter sp. zth1]|uniref:dipicolinate synthase subunit DpsA n=1 Tax=Sedimentibacter sp. zth1 TaxID=2816908 RepID=UPI001A939FB8|nr:dipicolinate synthase subunit DpsA [Sedimentibacter sp. zth1]QSX05791.1 dipicolinate synthase subunit DpsA [Sedimentibacter sp. zth1]